MENELSKNALQVQCNGAMITPFWKAISAPEVTPVQISFGMKHLGKIFSMLRFREIS
jgi:hypothetical protein